MKQTTPKTKKPRAKISIGSWILIGSLSIIAVIGIYFASIMYSAYSSSGQINVGNRFKLELNPKIESAKIADVKTAISAESFTVKTSIDLKSATLRIMVQVKPELTAAELSAAILKIKDDVNAALPIATYFTSTADVKMYDLEIQVFNAVDAVSTATFTYHDLILVKNNGMNTWLIQDVAVPLNAQLAAQLDAILNPKAP